MIIAFTTSGNTLEAPLDPRFGRTPGFLSVDTETGNLLFSGNEQNLNAAQGAGIQSAQNAASSGAQAVVTGHCGPKAFRVLSASNIPVFLTSATTVGEALELFKAGKLETLKSADVEGHWA